MIELTLYDTATGVIQHRAVVEREETINEQVVPPGWGYVVGGYDRNAFWIDNGTPTALPPLPNAFCYLDHDTKQWVDSRTLEQMQAFAWGAMKALRFQKEVAGFSWDGSVFDSDQVSQSRIMGAVQLAGMSSTFTIPWTLQDNTVRVLSASDMMAVGAALGTHVSAIFARAQELRVEIYAATTIAAVEAITWDV